MPFEEALKHIKNGQRVARSGWNGKGMWAALQTPDPLSKMTLPYIYMKAANGGYAPWTPTQCDILAEDWCLVE
jgi:hypothetical protein